jgi:peptidoglycan LD-endopeptidase CwlK
MKFDERTEKNLATLDPKAQPLFRAFIKEAREIAGRFGVEYIMISGNRTWEEQNELYAKGRTKPGKIVTNARGGYSNHNFKIAADFGVFKNKKYLDGTNPPLASKVHKLVGTIVAKYNLEWGGNWKNFKDEPHFEVRTGLTLAQKRERFKSKGTVL